MFRSATATFRATTSLSGKRLNNGGGNSSILFRRWFCQTSGGLSQSVKPESVKQMSQSSITGIYNNNIHNKHIGYWLLGCAGLVFGMVGIGGITRLTRSGLSMTDWHFTGGLPPMNQDEWINEFTKYQKFPEFKRINHGMTLDEFKSIYFWEYTHRMYGRMIGLLFVLPLSYFIVRGKIKNTQSSGYLGYKLSALGLLGGSQGLIGWWMVKSGLEEDGNGTLNDLPRVSPYRLSTHLGFAFTLYTMLLYFSMQSISLFNLQNLAHASQKVILPSTNIPAPTLFRYGSASLFSICFLTAIFGAFVAGNDAGLVFSEWPRMGNGFIPSDLICDESILSPKWRNLFENSSCVQFVHRNLAYLTVISSLSLMMYSRRLSRMDLISPQCYLGAHMTGILALCQASLGIYTLINYCPIHAASAHQCGSMAVLSSALYCAFLARKGGYGGCAQLYHQMAKHKSVRYIV